MIDENEDQPEEGGKEKLNQDNEDAEETRYGEEKDKKNTGKSKKTKSPLDANLNSGNKK